MKSVGKILTLLVGASMCSNTWASGLRVWVENKTGSPITVQWANTDAGPRTKAVTIVDRQTAEFDQAARGATGQNMNEGKVLFVAGSGRKEVHKSIKPTAEMVTIVIRDNAFSINDYLG